MLIENKENRACYDKNNDENCLKDQKKKIAKEIHCVDKAALRWHSNYRC